MKNDRTDELREASGRVVYSDPLTSFLYQLIRDELPAGTVEKIVRDSVQGGEQEVLFTNGWLAQYANNLAEMIKNAHTEKLKESLTKVFDEEEQKENAKVVSKAMDKLRKNGTLEEFSDDELAELEDKVVSACKKAEEIDTEGTEPVIAWTSFEEAAEMIEHLKAEGQISKEDAERLNNELKEVEIEVSIDAKDTEVRVIEPIELTDEVIEEVKPASGNNWFRATDQSEEAESKPACCGKCKENTISGMCADVEQTDKWQETQKFLDNMDKELENLMPKNNETKVIINPEPKIVSQEESKEINNMLAGMGQLLNAEPKEQ